MRQCEYKKRYDPEKGRYVKKHIYSEEISDVMKSIGSKLFGQTMKKKTLKAGIQKGAEKAIENAGTKTGDFAAKKAGKEIIELLSKNKKVNNMETPLTPTTKVEQLTNYEINERVNQLLSGGRLRRKII